jgi:hypothetical protein
MTYRKKLIIALTVLALATSAWAASDAYFSSEQNGRVWTLKSGGEINIASGATLAIAGSAFDPTSYVPVTKPGQQTIGATNAGDDGVVEILFEAPEGDGPLFRVTTKDTAGVDATTFEMTEAGFVVDSAEGEIAMTAATGPINLQASAENVQIVADDTTFIVRTAGTFGGRATLLFDADATLPTCDTTLAPAGMVAFHWDTTGPDLCVCDGSSWAPQDGSGTCA